MSRKSGKLYMVVCQREEIVILICHDDPGDAPEILIVRAVADDVLYIGDGVIASAAKTSYDENRGEALLKGVLETAVGIRNVFFNLQSDEWYIVRYAGVS